MVLLPASLPAFPASHSLYERLPRESTPDAHPIASGIDLPLHLVTIRHGPTASARIARTMVVYARRNGDEQQASVLPRHGWHVNETVHYIQDIIESRVTERLSLSELARLTGYSQRTVTRPAPSSFEGLTELLPL